MRLFSIDQMPPLVLSFCSIRGKEISNARSTASNRLLENLSHNPIEPFHFSHGKPSDSHVGVKAGPEEYLIGVDVSDAGNDLLMHQKRLQPTASFSQNSHKIRLRHEKGINPESAREISFKPRLVQQRKTTEATRVPVPQFPFTGTVEQQPDMHMLWMFRPRGLEQKEAGHPELRHYIAAGLFIHKFKGNALAESFDRLQTSALVPRQGGVAFSHDVRTTDPYFSQPGPEKTRPDLSGNNFCFWKFRHKRTTLGSRKNLITP